MSRDKYTLSDAETALLLDPLNSLSDNGHRVEVCSVTAIRGNVYRLALDGTRHRSVVVKRMQSPRSNLERQVTDRWLPAVAMDGFGPPRLLTVGDPDGRHSWHVYDDLGARGLDRPDADAASVAAATTRVAFMHAAIARSGLLPEVRFAACDMGVYFYTRSVRDALRSVERLHPPDVAMSADDEAVRDGVLDLLRPLAADEPRRRRMLERDAGPETLVHGDLTRANVFVTSENGAHRARLIDWERCGVGPAGFDISTHVAYYDDPLRQHALDSYTAAMADLGFPFRDDLDWDLLVSTFESGRLANQIIWVAMGIREGNGWTFSELAAWRDVLEIVASGRSAKRADGVSA